MSFIFSCINNVLIFIILVLPGFFGRKLHIIKSHHIDGVSSIIVNILWPAMVIDVMSKMQVNDDSIRTVLVSGSISIIIYLVSSIIFLFYWKIRHANPNLVGILTFCCACNNTGFIGMPFIRAALGDEALFIASIPEVVNDLFIFTIGVALTQYGSEEKKGFDLKSMLSPGFISVFVGLFIFFFDIPLPSCIASALSYMSNAITAMAMLLVGAQLGEINLKQLLTEQYVFEISCIRLAIIPLLVAVALYFFLPNQTLIAHVLILMFAMPCASSCAILARQYNRDYQKATSYVMTSTLLLIITLPFWSIITTWLFQ